MNRRGFLQAALGLGAGLVVGDDPERAGWVKGERVYSFARPIVQGIPDGFLAALKAFTAEHGSPLETSLNDALFPRLIYKEPVIGHIDGGVRFISSKQPRGGLHVPLIATPTIEMQALVGMMKA